MWLLWVIGAGVIVVLGLIAARMQWRVRQLRQAREQQMETLQQGRSQQVQSIEIICRALLEGQVAPAEAGVRVAGLLNQLQVEASARAAFDSFDEMDRAVSHIPRLKAWTELESDVRRRYQREIDAAETRIGGSMRQASEKIVANGVEASIAAAAVRPA